MKENLRDVSGKIGQPSLNSASDFGWYVPKLYTDSAESLSGIVETASNYSFWGIQNYTSEMSSV